MSERRTLGPEVAQFAAPDSLPIDALVVPDFGEFAVDASQMHDYEEPEATSRFYWSHAYYAKALRDGRNSGEVAYNAFFPKESEAFHERASEVTPEELTRFYKKMNEQWTAANEFLRKGNL